MDAMAAVACADGEVGAHEQAYHKLREEILGGMYDGVTELDLSNRGLAQLPAELCDLTQLTKLNAAGNDLTDLPDGFDRLVNLRILFFLGNKFSSVPKVLGRMPGLYMLSFKSCRLTSVPDESLAPSLGWLILTDNQLESLPAALGRLRHLRKLMLASNKLSSLPDDWSGCESLELVRLSDNRLTAIPPSLLTLPRLAWIALAGNHLAPRHRDQPLAVPAELDIPWTELELGPRLGDGASGTVYEARWARSDREAPLPVAVKVYKPASSDGRVVDEMAACLALASSNAPSDSNLIRTIGLASSSPLSPSSATQAIVMELLDSSSMSLLGATPSFASVTRDVYPPGTEFTIAQALAIVRGVTAAVASLHAAGIAHGDVYAHNTLVGAADGASDQRWKVKLGDLGAAYFLPSSEMSRSEPGLDGSEALPSPSSDPSFYLRRLESLAIGCLIEELLERVPRSTHEGEAAVSEVAAELAKIRDACMNPNVAARPDPTALLGTLPTLG